MVLTTPVEMHTTLFAKMHMHSYMRAHATVQKLLSCASIVQAVVGRPLLQPLLLSRPNTRPDAVCSRKPSKSTLSHDAVAAAVSHKHHLTSAFVQASSSLSMGRSRTWPRSSCITIPIPVSSSSNGPTTTTLKTRGLCPGSSVVWAGPKFVLPHM